MSPLLNDPHYKTIGIGTSIFLGGGIGYVGGMDPASSQCIKGEMESPKLRPELFPLSGDLKQMDPNWLVASVM